MFPLTADFQLLNCGAWAYHRLTRQDKWATSAHVLVAGGKRRERERKKENLPSLQTWTDASVALVCRNIGLGAETWDPHSSRLFYHILTKNVVMLEISDCWRCFTCTISYW